MVRPSVVGVTPLPHDHKTLKNLYVSSYGHQIWTAGTLPLVESIVNCFTGNTDIIIPWSHETDKSLYIELWRGYDHHILKTGIPWEESIRNHFAGGNLHRYLMILWHFLERSQWGTPSQVMTTLSPDKRNISIYCQYIFFI